MKRFTLCCVLAGAAFAPGAAVAGGLDALDRFAGTWTAPGTMLDTRYSKAASAQALNVCAWQADHTFMVCQQRVTMGGKTTRDISVYTYDDAAHAYHFYNVRQHGVDSVPITVVSDTITYTSSFTDTGKHVTIRTLNIWDRPGLYHWRTEYTTDGGTTWHLMGSGIARRR